MEMVNETCNTWKLDTFNASLVRAKKNERKEFKYDKSNIKNEGILYLWP